MANECEHVDGAITERRIGLTGRNAHTTTAASAAAAVALTTGGGLVQKVE